MSPFLFFFTFWRYLWYLYTFFTVLPPVAVLALAGVATIPFEAVAAVQTRGGVADRSRLY